jgi:hypothetical protein
LSAKKWRLLGVQVKQPALIQVDRLFLAQLRLRIQLLLRDGGTAFPCHQPGQLSSANRERNNYNGFLRIEIEKVWFFFQRLEILCEDGWLAGTSQRGGNLFAAVLLSAAYQVRAQENSIRTVQIQTVIVWCDVSGKKLWGGAALQCCD